MCYNMPNVPKNCVDKQFIFCQDFYADNHWAKMPPSWKQVFDELEPGQLAPLLSNTGSNVVWPLSLLATRTLMAKLNIPRQEDKVSIEWIVGNRLYIN